jgi:DNA-binding SARP family transcriptional activator
VVIWQEDDFDELTNSVPDLLRAGRIEEAERAATELLERYPETVAGLDRMARVEEAKGNNSVAADYYRQAARFAQTNPGFDPEVADRFLQQAERLEG